MEKNLAKQVIIEAIELAYRKGCYGIVESGNIQTAISVLELNQKTQAEQLNPKQDVEQS
jgi:hypothetical protein